MTASDSGLFEAVRAGCASVARLSRSVVVDEAAIPAYAASLSFAGLPEPAYDREHHFLGDATATVAYILSLDAVNFGSGWFPLLRKRPGMSGYATVASSLADRFRSHGAWSAAELRDLSPAACAGIFGQEPDGPVADLLALFTHALNDLGAWLEDGWTGDWTGPVREANGSAEQLVGLLLEMELFRDVAAYEGLQVPLLKRAQLAVADLALAFNGEGFGRFDDLDRLTIFADNLVPHVLRLDGVLRYDPALVARIERGDLIPAGSPEEVEIRAVALRAAELIVAELGRQGNPTTAARLDFLLWNRGQVPAYKTHPRHRTRTVFY
ncbi:MAG TPA: queuosine salvage family protein [Thermomicrobiales bacterium]|nr:queuosine salvage family protein [Thermomicrobiales bacterium]